jgi:hypothetical protein
VTLHAPPDSMLGLLVTGARQGPPWLRITVSPRLARFLIAAGARPVPSADSMTATFRATDSAREPLQPDIPPGRPEPPADRGPADKERALAAQLAQDLRDVLAALPERLQPPAEVRRTGALLQVTLSAELAGPEPGVRLSLTVRDAHPPPGAPQSRMASLAGLPLLVSGPGQLAQIIRLDEQGQAAIQADPQAPIRIRLPRTRAAGGVMLAQIPPAGTELPSGVGVASSRRRYMRQETDVDHGLFTVTFFEEESGELRAAARSSGDAHLGWLVLLADTRRGDKDAREFVIPLAQLDPAGRASGSLILGQPRPGVSWFVSLTLISDITGISDPVLQRSLEAAGDPATREYLRRALGRPAR